MTIPAHIPAERVVDFDRFSGPELGSCPHRRVSDGSVEMCEVLLAHAARPGVQPLGPVEGDNCDTRVADFVETLTHGREP